MSTAGGPVSLVNLRGFKRFAERNLPHESPLFKVILAEKDELDAKSFLSKSEVWLELIDISIQPVVRGGLTCLPSPKHESVALSELLKTFNR